MRVQIPYNKNYNNSGVHIEVWGAKKFKKQSLQNNTNIINNIKF